jgi:hypothetical protein
MTVKDGNFMNTIIFVDFENIQSIKNEHINKNTEIIILVGIGQEKKALQIAEELLEKVSSINLINVNGRGPNAMDNFLIFYLGCNYERIKDKNIIVYIYSDDKGYLPLKDHLCEKGVSIEIINKEIKQPKQKKQETNIPKKENKSDKQNIDSSNKNYEKIIENIQEKTKKGKERPRPKTIKGLKTSIKNWTKLKNECEVMEIINKLKKENKINVQNNNKIKYNT